MKWNDLTLKERKRIYDSVKSNNPNITYLELKEQFDNIPAYEDGEESEDQRRERLWKEYKLSIGKDTATVNNFHRPTTLNSNPIQDKKTFEILEGLPRLLTTDQYDKISQSGDDIKEAAVKTNKEKYEKTKQGLNAAGILAQAGLAFAGSAAGAMGYSNLSNAIGAGQSIWNAYELANSIDEKDTLGIIQNGIPLALYGAGITKYIPRVNQMRGVDAISKIGNNGGLIWDWLPNPIIEAFKIKRDREIQK